MIALLQLALAIVLLVVRLGVHGEANVRGASAESPLPGLSAVPLKCPRSMGTDANNSLRTLPRPMTLRLSAEPKSGTTWVTLMVANLLVEICSLYDTGVEGFRCSHSCYENNTANDNATWVDHANYGDCRTIFFTFTQQLRGETVASVIVLQTRYKHVIPFIATTEGLGHPNGTPLAPIPQWLHDCLVNGVIHCTPPDYALAEDGECDADQNAAMLEAIRLARESDGLVSASQLTRRPAPTVGWFSIIRDPRSVLVSAGNYVPGLMVYGTKTNVNLNEFTVDFINTTTAWTQFRYHWLRNMVGALFPTFLFFYETLGTQPVAELERLAAFVGMCYTDALVRDVAERNTQAYYAAHDNAFVGSVPVVREESRPNDTLTGFMLELSPAALAVCNASLAMGLAPALAKRWLGDTAYKVASARGWLPAPCFAKGQPRNRRRTVAAHNNKQGGQNDGEAIDNRDEGDDDYDQDDDNNNDDHDDHDAGGDGYGDDEDDDFSMCASFVTQMHACCRMTPDGVSQNKWWNGACEKRSEAWMQRQRDRLRHADANTTSGNATSSDATSEDGTTAVNTSVTCGQYPVLRRHLDVVLVPNATDDGREPWGGIKATHGRCWHGHDFLNTAHPHDEAAWNVSE
jgi:hypothetical protein